MKSVNPYLNFPGNTEEAFGFYRSVFGGEFTEVVRFRDFPGNPMRIPEHLLDKIAHIGLPLGRDHVLMATDMVSSSHELTMGNNFSITLEADTPQEADELYDALSAGGSAKMPLQKTEWAEKFGHCVDRFGVQWMVMYTGAVEFDLGEGSA